MIRFDAGELERLWAHAREGYPYEVVGVLAGHAGHVERVEPLRNERTDVKNRYRVSGLTLMKAERRLEAGGLEILGYYHSHPDHHAQYSAYDRDHALPNLSYVITAVHDGVVVDTQSWRLLEDRSAMQSEALAIDKEAL